MLYLLYTGVWTPNFRTVCGNLCFIEVNPPLNLESYFSSIDWLRTDLDSTNLVDDVRLCTMLHLLLAKHEQYTPAPVWCLQNLPECRIAPLWSREGLQNKAKIKVPKEDRWYVHPKYILFSWYSLGFVYLMRQNDENLRLPRENWNAAFWLEG